MKLAESAWEGRSKRSGLIDLVHFTVELTAPGQKDLCSFRMTKNYGGVAGRCALRLATNCIGLSFRCAERRPRSRLENCLIAPSL